MRFVKGYKENFICKKIEKLIHEKGLNNRVIVEIIDKRSSLELKEICTITLERMNEITNGSTPTVIECLIIGQVLGKGLGYFYYNGYQI